jgi:hypothetical protein
LARVAQEELPRPQAVHLMVVAEESLRLENQTFNQLLILVVNQASSTVGFIIMALQELLVWTR